MGLVVFVYLSVRLFVREVFVENVEFRGWVRSKGVGL